MKYCWKAHMKCRVITCKQHWYRGRGKQDEKFYIFWRGPTNLQLIVATNWNCHYWNKLLLTVRVISPRTARRLEQAARANQMPDKAPRMVVERHTKSARNERRRIDVYVRPTGSALSNNKHRPRSNMRTPMTTARSNPMSTPGRRDLSPPQRNKVM